MQKRDWSIGLWGPTLFGKTVYLGMLHHVANRVVPGWTMRAVGDDREKAAEWAANIHRTIFGLRRLPAKTEGKTPEKYTFELSGYGRFGLGQLRAKVLFNDMPGESVFTPDPYPDLAACDGILCFVDPQPDLKEIYDQHPEKLTLYRDNVPGFYQEAFQYLFEHIPGADQGRRHLFCFVLTKLDSEERLWKARRGPAADLIRAIVGEGSMMSIAKECRYVNYQACSALGALERGRRYLGPNCRRAEDGTLFVQDAVHLSAYNLLGPVRWLMQRFKWADLWGR